MQNTPNYRDIKLMFSQSVANLSKVTYLDGSEIIEFLKMLCEMNDDVIRFHYSDYDFSDENIKEFFNYCNEEKTRLPDYYKQFEIIFKIPSEKELKSSLREGIELMAMQND